MTVAVTGARAIAGRTAAKKASGSAVKTIDSSVAAKRPANATAFGGTVDTTIRSPKAPRSPRPKASDLADVATDSSYGFANKKAGGGASKVGINTKALTKAVTGGNGRRVLVAEFLVCITILALSPLGTKHSGDSPVAWMKRGAAICALFFILALVSSGGPKAAKVSAGFGGIVTLALLLSSKDLFSTLAARFSGGPGTAGVDDSGVAGDVGTAAAGALDDLGNAVNNLPPANGGLPNGVGQQAGTGGLGGFPQGGTPVG